MKLCICSFVLTFLFLGCSKSDLDGNFGLFPAKLTILAKDTDSGSKTHTDSQSVELSIAGEKMRSFCISESQITRPSKDSPCSGGVGPNSGWHTTAPSNFSFSPGDGLKTIYVWYLDQSNLVGEEPITYSIYLDKTAPTIPTLISGPVNYHNSVISSFSFSATDTGSGVDTYLCELNGGGFTPCSEGFNTSVLSDGVHSLQVKAVDKAGNSSGLLTHNWVVDTVAPVINLTTNFSLKKGGETEDISWNLTEVNSLNTQNFTLEYYDGSSWQAIGTQAVTDGPHNMQSFTYSSFTYPSVDITNAKIRVSYTDLAGNLTQAESSDFLIDSSGPVVSSLDINSGATFTGNYNVSIDVTASDSVSKITEFCVKYNNSTQPLAEDSCWLSVSTTGLVAASNINLTGYTYNLGLIEGNYAIRFWFKDEAEHISTLTNAGSGTQAQDLYNILYEADTAPVLSEVTVANSDNPSSPLQSLDTTLPMGSDVYIKWKAIDNKAFPATPIDLYYTTDEENYTLIAANLDNSTNGSCTLQAAVTGCYHWVSSSPMSTYYKVRVVAKDSSDAISMSTSNPVNVGSVNFLTGNTELGLNGSAQSAIFFSRYEESTSNTDIYSLSVRSDGLIFFKDQDRGILYIDPADGIQKLLLPKTGSFSGDGGDVSLATLRAPLLIHLDHEENLLIWDYNRVRKVDLSVTPWTISTIIGGGADSSSGAAALAANIPVDGGHINEGQLVPTPNGNIYFVKNKGLWFYEKLTNTVKQQIQPNGLGTGNMVGDYANYDNLNCLSARPSIAYNPANSQITKYTLQRHIDNTASCGNQQQPRWRTNTNYNLTTGTAEAPHPPDTEWSSYKYTGLDGKIYWLDNGKDRLFRYNEATNSWEHILGVSSNTGRCADGTLATACNVTQQSVFVNKFGQIYFVDLGLIRYIDSEKRVQTLAGQSRNFGIGFSPLSARYAQVNYFDVVNNKIYLEDDLEKQIKSFDLAGGNLEHIAGNGISGIPAYDTDAKNEELTNCGWGAPCGFWVDGVNNRLYRHKANLANISYIDLALGQWKDTAQSFGPSSARVSYIAASGDNILGYTSAHYGAIGNINKFTVFNTSTNVQTTIYGNETKHSGSPNICADGSTGTDCLFGSMSALNHQTQFKHDSTTDKWLIAKRGESSIHEISTLGGTLSTLTEVRAITAFEHRRLGPDRVVYYCSMTGKLYKKNLTTTVETELLFPTTSMTCKGMALHYDSSRDSLIFIYHQNGLDGIAEYLSPGS